MAWSAPALIAACLVQVGPPGRYLRLVRGYCAITTSPPMAYTGVAAHLLRTQSGFADTAQVQPGVAGGWCGHAVRGYLVGTLPRRLLDWLPWRQLGIGLRWPTPGRAYVGTTVPAAWRCAL